MDGVAGQVMQPKVKTVANMDWSFVWEAFAVAANIPACAWQVLVDEGAISQDGTHAERSQHSSERY
jgi:hypothetical protein